MKGVISRIFYNSKLWFYVLIYLPSSESNFPAFKTYTKAEFSDPLTTTDKMLGSPSANLFSAFNTFYTLGKNWILQKHIKNIPSIPSLFLQTNPSSWEKLFLAVHAYWISIFP